MTTGYVGPNGQWVSSADSSQDAWKAVRETSFVATAGGTSQKVAIDALASAASSAITGSEPYVFVRVTVSVASYYRQGAAPTAVSDGTDEYLAADCTYRLKMTSGNKLAFIPLSGTGNAYITPEG